MWNPYCLQQEVEISYAQMLHFDLTWYFLSSHLSFFLSLPALLPADILPVTLNLLGSLPVYFSLSSAFLSPWSVLSIPSPVWLPHSPLSSAELTPLGSTFPSLQISLSKAVDFSAMWLLSTWMVADVTGNCILQLYKWRLQRKCNIIFCWNDDILSIFEYILLN